MCIPARVSFTLLSNFYLAQTLRVDAIVSPCGAKLMQNPIKGLDLILYNFIECGEP